MVYNNNIILLSDLSMTKKKKSDTLFVSWIRATVVGVKMGRWVGIIYR